MKKKHWIYLAILFIGGASIGMMIYHKPHKNIGKTEADFEFSAKTLYAAFEQDEATANARYLDKVIEVTGIVKSKSTDENGILSFTLDTGNDLAGVICQMDHLTQHKNLNFQPGSTISLKGICTGMLMDVILVRCVVK